jgi:hypothetical protein
VKVFKQGFYWPSIIDDASKLIKTCQACKKFSLNTQTHPQPSQLITPLWPLQVWGIDIVGPLTTAQGNYKYAVVVGGIFHKMDRGEASSQHSSNGTGEIFLTKHNMPFWSAQRDNSRQCQAIQLPHMQGFLPLDEGRSSFCISISPSVQRSSGKSECIDIHNHKEDTRESAERQMGRRIVESSMEPQ